MNWQTVIFLYLIVGTLFSIYTQVDVVDDLGEPTENNAALIGTHIGVALLFPVFVIVWLLDQMSIHIDR